jgi:adenylylsulfate kinase-like enzyme
MGPSCAGKSTLSKYVCEQLNAENESWVVVDFDEVGENIEQLLKTANDYLAQDINVIVDTNTYENEMEKRFYGGSTVTKIIVTAPLEVLLQRDERRTQRLKRDEKRAFWCKHFVIESFERSLVWPSDLIIDSCEQSIEESCVIFCIF